MPGIEEKERQTDEVGEHAFCVLQTQQHGKLRKSCVTVKHERSEAEVNDTCRLAFAELTVRDGYL
jgi:hypothetical protein